MSGTLSWTAFRWQHSLAQPPSSVQSFVTLLKQKRERMKKCTETSGLKSWLLDSPQRWGCLAGCRGTGSRWGSSAWAVSGSGWVCRGWWWWCLRRTCQTGGGRRGRRSAWHPGCPDPPGRPAWRRRSECPVRRQQVAPISVWNKRTVPIVSIEICHQKCVQSLPLPSPKYKEKTTLWYYLDSLKIKSIGPYTPATRRCDANKRHEDANLF